MANLSSHGLVNFISIDAVTLSSGNPALDIINAQTWLSSVPVFSICQCGRALARREEQARRITRCSHRNRKRRGFWSTKPNWET